MEWEMCAFSSKQRSCRIAMERAGSAFPPYPSPSPPPRPGAALPAWIALPGILSPWAGCRWRCCIRALCLQSSGAGAGLNRVIPLLKGSQDLKGSAHSRSLLMSKKMCPMDGKSSLPGCGKVSHLFVWRNLIVSLLLQNWQELWCS